MNLFDNIKQSVFASSEILSNSHIPQRLPSRDNEITSVSTIFRPALMGGVPPNVIIYGKTGSGKTACVKYVIQEFERARKKQRITHAPYIYMTCCVDTKGPIDLIIKILRSIDKKNTTTTGHSTHVYYDKLFAHLNKARRGLILILDEIDAIKKGQEFLYMLSRASEMREIKNGIYISIIGLTNNMQYATTMDPRVKSSFGTHWILFPPYTAIDLLDILEDRRKAYHVDAIEEGVIPLCAAIADQEYGDARKSIDLFRTAGEIADRAASSRVLMSHVQNARIELEQEQIKALLIRLPLQSTLVLGAIIELRENGHIISTTGEISKTYFSLATTYTISPLTHRRVTDLISELAMLGLINSKKRSRGRAQGYIREVWLTLSDEEIHILNIHLETTLTASSITPFPSQTPHL